VEEAWLVAVFHRAHERLLGGSSREYRESMVTLVRAARMVLLLLLALVTVSLVIGLGSPVSGPVEKVALVALIAGCIFLAAKLPSLTSAVERRLHHR
jgi:hypothetical protein